MSDITKEQVVEWLSAQTALEVADLVKELEEKWGVSAAAPVAVRNDSAKGALPFSGFVLLVLSMVVGVLLLPRPFALLLPYSSSVTSLPSSLVSLRAVAKPSKVPAPIRLL